MGPQVQALALAWTQPYAVACNSITSALTLGFVPERSSQTCAPSPPSVFFNQARTRPFTELGVRPRMLLASKTVASGMALIDRGVVLYQTAAVRVENPANMDWLLGRLCHLCRLVIPCQKHPHGQT